MEKQASYCLVSFLWWIVSKDYGEGRAAEIIPGTELVDLHGIGPGQQRQ